MFTMDGTLFVVATPIGNLDDLSPRARECLAAVDLIAAEDTRHTGRMLSRLSVQKPMIPLHDHNERDQVGELIARLSGGENIALVSDAGTPLISDPGFRLVREAQSQSIRVVPIPGPSAVTAALSALGLPSDRFAFEGFLPAKQKARRDRLQALAGETRTLVFFETRHRIAAALDDLVSTFGAQRSAGIAREISKLHEQVVAASLAELAAAVRSGDIPEKGEYVLVVTGAEDRPAGDIDIDRWLAGLSGHLPPKVVASVVAEVTGERRNRLYDRLLELAAGDREGE